MTTLFSIIESPAFPNFGAFFSQHKIEETIFSSMRKALSQLKKQQPDYIVCEFHYRYGTDYAGCTVSNLDVLLATLQKYSPDTSVIVLVEKSEREYVNKLTDLFPIHAVIVYPVQVPDMEAALSL